MATAREYVKDRGNLTFDQDPVNEVDIFLCSQISMPDYKDIVSRFGKEVTIEEASTNYFLTHTTSVDNLGVLQPKYLLPVFQEMGKCARYKDAALFGYENVVNPEKEEQFAAITIRLTKDLLCVSFRATDDTLVAWKENLDLAMYDEVQAQRDAVKYLEWVAVNYEGKIIVTGHSKGGNLAIYSAAKVSDSTKERIPHVYSFDGPGFRKKFFKYEGYRDMAERMSTIRPHYSMVGLMFVEAGGDLSVVHTNVKGMWAHDGFNWEVDGTAFVREKELSRLSRSINKAIDEVVDSLSEEETKELIDIIYSALTSTGAKTLMELKKSSIFKRIGIVFKLLGNKKIRRLGWRVIGRTIKYLFSKY